MNLGIVLLLCFRLSSGFEAFDCSLNPQNIKAWDLTDISDCQRPQDLYDAGEKTLVQIVRNEEFQPQEVWECKIFQTVTATRCVFDSITYSSFELQTFPPVLIASDEFRRLINSQKISMYGKNWDIYTIGHFSFAADIIGKF